MNNIYADYEGRFRLLHLDPQAVIGLFQSWHGHEYLSLPVLDDLPVGTEVVAVHSDWASKSLQLLVYHPSFEVVPDGGRPPFAGAVKMHAVRLKRNYDEGESYDVPRGE